MFAFFIGIVLGLLFFGGLYFTVQKINEVKYPGLLMTVSLFLRMAGLVVGFFFLAKGGYKDILFALIGVILARFILTFTNKKQNISSEKRGD